MEGISLWLAVLLLLFVHPLYAEASESGRENAGELRFVDDQGRHLESATLMNADYQVKVTGLVADVELKQTFQNTSQQWREAVYVFPLPEKASVYGMTMTSGERRIVGEIREKSVAKKEYDTAKSEGRKVARVDQQRPNLFTTHLANIPPGESIAIELSYQQPVRYQSGEFDLRIPTTITPRYMPGEIVHDGPKSWQSGWAMPTTDVPDADQISPYTVLPQDLGPGSHQATVSMSIRAGLPVSRVSSPSHRLTNTWNGNTVEVKAENGHFSMDRDLIVRWAPTRGMAPSAAVFQEQWQGENYLMAMMIPGLETQQQVARELVFVIDTSGSMAGESIRQATQSLLRGLETLGPDDTFNVIQFNSQTASLFIDPVPADGNYLARARRYVGNLAADGGTEMAPALDAALNRRGSETADGVQRLRQVVFITDGSVGNESALFQRIKQQLGDTRLFTVGIGSAPNMHFMREAARFGRGTYTSINSTSDVERPLDELFGKMQSAVLTDIQVDWPDAGANQSAQPQRIGDLFRGEPMIQVVRGQAAQGEVRVSGRLPNGSVWQQSLDLEQAASGKGLHRVWARQKIDGLLDARTLGRDQSEDGQDQTKEKVTDLGIQHQLITPYTSFLAVDKTPSRPVDSLLASDNVPTLLPAGSDAGMLRYPQTATVAPLLQALGLLGLVFGAAITLLKRRVCP
ncbi:marine proteobacterial sortase target protein [Marinobacter confluentis]|uniref:Marine proteobacterial sortase target protein n=1 Tax=Marinobacter confluentis TaxID=1697557 RepID=A0A4Z1BW19_9GAMM|nr:marine proteobacterial sortase target protein [Marinobacter confluentis]TGN38840.1 marine proteobacterial sortase target protein [Marinobacter confluentis]